MFLGRLHLADVAMLAFPFDCWGRIALVEIALIFMGDTFLSGRFDRVVTYYSCQRICLEDAKTFLNPTPREPFENKKSACMHGVVCMCACV